MYLQKTTRMQDQVSFINKANIQKFEKNAGNKKSDNKRPGNETRLKRIQQKNTLKKGKYINAK